MYEANKGELASRTPPSMALMEIAELAILVDVNDVTNSNSLASGHYKRAATRSINARLASRTSGPMGVVFSMPVIARACQLIINCIPASRSLWPCHWSSAPYRATDCTATTWSRQASSG